MSIYNVSAARVDELSPVGTEKIDRLAAFYGEHLVRSHVLPNFSTVETAIPTGMVFEFTADAPIFSSPFDSTHFMTAGTSVFQTEHPLDVSSPALVKKAKNLMAATIQKTETNGPPLASSTRDPETNGDKKGTTYAPRLAPGSDGSVGIYTGSVISKNKRHDATFIVVSGGIPSISRDLVTSIDNKQRPLVAGRPHMSNIQDLTVQPLNRGVSTALKMKDVIEAPEMKYATRAAVRNRCAMAAAVSDAFSLGITKIEDRSAGTAGMMIGLPLCNVQTNILEPKDETHSGGGYVYFSNAMNASLVRGYAPLKLAPSLGYTLLKGVPSSAHVTGLGWTNDACNAFPADVGRRVDAATAYSFAANADVPAIHAANDVRGDHPFCWSTASKLAYNGSTHPETFNYRDATFLAAEQQLGRDLGWGEIDLKPQVVWMDSTPSKKLGATMHQSPL